MSILIKGMEMPENCRHCPMYYHRLSYCNATHRSLGYADEPDKNRMVWCPLVEVPTPHGRLIDSDDAMQKGWTISRIYAASRTENVYETKQICELPTIIEAEPPKEE